MTPSAALTYIPVQEAGNIIFDTSARRAGLVEGQFTTPAFAPESYDPAAMRSLYGALPPLAELERPFKTDPASRGFLRAYSVKEHRVKWETQTATSFDGGVLATGGRAGVPGRRERKSQRLWLGYRRAPRLDCRSAPR